LIQSKPFACRRNGFASTFAKIRSPSAFAGAGSERWRAAPESKGLARPLRLRLLAQATLSANGC